VIASIARVGLSAAVLFGAFALAPLDFRGRDVLGVRLAASVVLPMLVLGLQILAVARSPYPRLRAVEAVAISFPLLICLFASTYYGMGRANPAGFNEALTRTDALYFTVTVFATVGFGDIVASSQVARIAVTIQMVADLLLIGVIARVLLGTARQRRAALEADPTGRPDTPSAPRPAPAVSVAPARVLGGADDHLDDEAEDDQVQNHLRRDDQARRLAGRHDVAEAHRGEHRDGEVERVGPAQRGGVEVAAVGVRHQEVGGREQQQEHRDGSGERFRGADTGMGGAKDRPHLVDGQGSDRSDSPAHHDHSQVPGSRPRGAR
jgi:hypothetical protein